PGTEVIFPIVGITDPGNFGLEVVASSRTAAAAAAAWFPTAAVAAGAFSMAASSRGKGQRSPGWWPLQHIYDPLMYRIGSSDGGHRLQGLKQDGKRLGFNSINICIWHDGTMARMQEDASKQRVVVVCLSSLDLYLCVQPYPLYSYAFY
ncbi:hypothetical protein EJB05_05508, partial [Eragrostis curvula]